MKMILTLACIALTSLLSAQTDAEKAIGAQLDQMRKAIHDKDFSTFTSIFTDDVAIYGTDPGEAPFETAAAMKSMEGLFAMDDVVYKYDLKERDIMVNADQKSALVVEQGYHSILGKNIQARTVYQFVDTDGTWRCNFYSLAMIPLNEKMKKLDMALGED